MAMILDLQEDHKLVITVGVKDIFQEIVQSLEKNVEHQILQLLVITVEVKDICQENAQSLERNVEKQVVQQLVIIAGVKGIYHEIVLSLEKKEVIQVVAPLPVDHKLHAITADKLGTVQENALNQERNVKEDQVYLVITVVVKDIYPEIVQNQETKKVCKVEVTQVQEK